MSGAAAPARAITLAQLRREATSLRHPLARALLVLTFTTGLVDATTYLGLGHVFAANMTGNIVLLGFGIAHTGGLPVLAPIVSLCSFVIGAGIGGLLDSRLARRLDHGFPLAVGFEALVMGAGALVAALGHPHSGTAAGYLVIALLAVGMGLRNATVKALAIPDLTTTVLTMTLTGLAAGTPFGGGDGRGTVRRAAAVLAMLTGAIAGALLLKTSIALVLVVAAALTVATLAGYQALTESVVLADEPPASQTGVGSGSGSGAAS
jgi:uncharacterized membrane protein YoaK (UPF0700 family)